MDKKNYEIRINWLSAVLQDNSLDDIYNVGPNKPLSYLSIEAIYILGSTPEKLILWANDNGLKTKRNKAIERRTSRVGELLHVYNEEYLQKILNDNDIILEKANIPIEPEGYINLIHSNSISYDDFPEAYVVIANTFGESEHMVNTRKERFALEDVKETESE